MVGAAYGVLVVLDDDERVALRLELRERVEQHAVVARMQADRRLVEDVAHAAQVRAELGGEADALRFAARQRGRRAIEREIAQADIGEKGEPRGDLAHDVARDLGLAPGEGELTQKPRGITHRELRELGDRAPAKAHRERRGVEPRAIAGGTDLLVVFEPFVPPGFVAGLLGVEALELQPGAIAGRAPAVLRIEREQARVEVGVAAVAGGTRASGREHRDLAALTITTASARGRRCAVLACPRPAAPARARPLCRIRARARAPRAMPARFRGSRRARPPATRSNAP